MPASVGLPGTEGRGEGIAIARDSMIMFEDRFRTKTMVGAGICAQLE